LRNGDIHWKYNSKENNLELLECGELGYKYSLIEKKKRPIALIDNICFYNTLNSNKMVDCTFCIIKGISITIQA
jgi:hypothetical protein